MYGGFLVDPYWLPFGSTHELGRTREVQFRVDYPYILVPVVTIVVLVLLLKLLC